MCTHNKKGSIDRGTIYHYKLVLGHRRTRIMRMYHLAREEPFSPAVVLGLPTSTLGFSNQQVVKLSKGPALAQASGEIKSFWEFLHSWGGNWMCEGIDDDQETKEDATWIANGMRQNSLIWVTDGAYNRKKASNLSGVGWIISCTRTGLRLVGTFWEKSNWANLYRAEMLGLCALHLLAQAVAKFYKEEKWSAILRCNNKCALELSSHHRRRIRPSTKCADIGLNLRAIKRSFTGNFKYVHIYGHMDQYLKWEQLTLIQQLNWVCDTLTKHAITTATLQGYHSRQSQLLSREDVALVIWGNKVTGNISSPLRFHASKEVARQHLGMRTKDRWSNNKFNAVDWEHLDLALKNKTDMYKIWRSKQNSGFCGTRVQIGRFSGDACQDKQCPNCRCRETAMHIMLCPDKDCTKLLTEIVNELIEWMAQNDRTDPEILYWIPKYILTRGDKPLSEMGAMSHKFKVLANSQDLIGWRDFTKGYISTHFYEIQSFHLTMSSSYLNGEDSTKQFILKLLQITHSQWIY